MDAFGERGQLIYNTEDLLEYNRQASGANENQASLFSGLPGTKGPTLRLKESEPAKTEEKLLWEKELLGLYISGHPLDKWRNRIEKRDINIKKIKENYSNGMEVTFAGIIESVREVITKNNQRMAFLKIADFTDSIEAVAFPKIYTDAHDILKIDRCIALSARVSLRNGEKTVIIEKVKLL